MKKLSRAAIYFFYDKNGIVDSFVEYFLKDLIDNVDDLIIVCNGKLNDDGESKLKKYGEVLVRENKGFDVWAYKAGIEYFGWEKLITYDELIMLNSTIYGPIYPLKDTFSKMDKRDDLDFWGITKYFKYDGDPFGCISYGYIPDHIQSHFIAVRNTMLTSKEFRDHWDNMPMINSYSEAIGMHEAIFTKKFADLGYKWDTSVDMEELRHYSGYPMMMCPRVLVEKYKCPIFKRRSFFHDIDDSLNNTTGEQASELYEFIDKHTDFDVDMIWENILRNYHQYDILKNLNLVYTLPTDVVKEHSYNQKIALVYHVYFTDILEEQTMKYLDSVPESFHVYITTDNKEKKDVVEKKLSNYSFDKFEIRLIANRGRDVSSLLVGVKDVIMDYDLVCFAHDKKTAQVSPETIGASFAYKCLENILKNRNYVENIIATFEKNPRLGLLCPPEPNHSVFYATLGLEWGPNYVKTKKLAKKLGINVPTDPEKPAIAPYGTMFWFRPKAMKPLFDYDWNYEDFPPEPNKIDGSLLHAIERIYPLAVQQAGFYPAICMNDKFSSIEYNNLRHYARGYNEVLIKNGVGPTYIKMLGTTKKAFNDYNRIYRLIWRICYLMVMKPYHKLKYFTKAILIKLKVMEAD